MLLVCSLVWGKYYVHKEASISIKEIQADPARAIESLSQAIAIDPASSSALLKRGIAYRKLGDPQHAYSDLHKALDRSPRNLLARVELSKATLDIGNAKEALVILNPVIEEQADNFDVLVAYGLANVGMDNDNAAIDYFNSALAVAKDNDQRFIAQMDLAVPLSRVRRYDDSIKHLEAALAIRPNDAQAIWEMAHAYGEKGYFFHDQSFHAKALELATKALAIEPNSVGARMVKLDALFYLGERSQALLDLSTLIRDNPNEPTLLLQRSRMYADQGMYDLASRDLEAARRIMPTYAFDAKNLGLLQP